MYWAGVWTRGSSRMRVSLSAALIMTCLHSEPGGRATTPSWYYAKFIGDGYADWIIMGAGRPRRYRREDVETTTMGKVLVTAKIESMEDLYKVRQGLIKPEEV